MKPPYTPEKVERALFDGPNRFGGRVTVNGTDVGVSDSWSVIRVAPHSGGDGLDFWVAWRALGWHIDPQPQFTHLHRILTWERLPDALTLHTDAGDTLVVEPLLSDTDLTAWDAVRAIKKAAPRTWTEAMESQMVALREAADNW